MARAGCSWSSRPDGSGHRRGCCRRRSSTSMRASDRAASGPARPRLPPRVRDNGRFYVNSHGRNGDTASTNTGSEPNPNMRRTGPAGDPDHRPAVPEPQRRQHRLRPRRLPVHRHRRRRRRRRPGQPRPEPGPRCSARCSASTSTGRRRPALPRSRATRTSGGRPGRDLVAGPAQPVALDVRPRHRRPLDRRRRPGPLGGDRPLLDGAAAAAARTTAGGSSRAATATGRRRAARGRQDPADRRVLPRGRCSVTGGYVYRGASGTRRWPGATSSATTVRQDLGDRRGACARDADPDPRHEPADKLLRRRRGRRVVRRRTSAGPSTDSRRPGPDAFVLGGAFRRRRR